MARVSSQEEPAAGQRPEYRVEALAKGLRMLSLFTEKRPTWRLSDLAPAADLPVPTAYRVVMTLVAEGYLDRLHDGSYRPSVRVLTLGTAALRSLDLVTLATPRLRALAEDCGETVNLGTLSGDQVLYLVRIPNANLVTANIQVGSTLPAVHTSIGKVLLAQLSAAELSTAVSGSSFSASAGPNAHSTLQALTAELSEIRTMGWAVQDEELAHGLRSVAAPVCNAAGDIVAGMNVAVLARDWTTERLVGDLRPRLLEVAAGISALLGAEHPGSGR